MNANTLIAKREKTKTLPPGHYEKKKYEQAVSKEYASCKKVEALWHSRFRRAKFNTYRNWTEAEIKDICNKVCQAVWEKPIKGVVLNSVEVQDGAAAHYNYATKKIHFKYHPSFTTIIHELTHHVGERKHDDKFCEMENLLFYVAYEILTGKKPKSDW